MILFDIAVKTDRRWLPTVEAVASFVSDSGFYTEDYSELESDCQQITGAQLIDEKLLAMDKNVATVHIYIEPAEDAAAKTERLRALLDADGVKYELVTDKIDEDFWSEAWKKNYKPTHVGEHIVIVPCWEDYEAKKDDIILTLDPGMAFGTGTHESTRLCLKMLERYTRAGAKMLDVGTGSGILAIGALKLGAASARAFDIDDVAVKMSRRNIALNGFEDRFEVARGGLSEQFGGGFDIITANIVSDVIISIMPQVKKLLAAGGVFITSGIIDKYADNVAAAAEKNGLNIRLREDDDNWVSFAFEHK